MGDVVFTMCRATGKYIDNSGLDNLFSHCGIQYSRPINHREDSRREAYEKVRDCYPDSIHVNFSDIIRSTSGRCSTRLTTHSIF